VSDYDVIVNRRGAGGGTLVRDRVLERIGARRTEREAQHVA
jgi:hypothetical protein